MGEKGIQKKKVNYHVLFVPDTDSMDIRQFTVSLKTLVSVVAAVAVLIVAELACYIILSQKLDDADDRMQSLRAQVNEVVRQNSELIAEKKVLQEKITILSGMVDEKTQQEQSEQGYILTGCPSGGTYLR